MRLLAAALGTLLGTLAVAGGQAPSAATSEAYSFAMWREKASRVVVVLDAQTASLRAGAPFVPVPVAVGVEAKGPTLRLTPESFSLVDSAGRARGPAAYEALQASYGKLEADREFLETRHLTLGERFATAVRVPSDFYPPLSARRTRALRVELGPRTWFRTILYFPAPSAGLSGVLTLRLDAPGLPRPIEVRFRLP